MTANRTLKFLSIVTLSLLSTAAFADAVGVNVPLIFSKQVPKNQSDLLKSDIAKLGKISFNHADPLMLRMMGIPNTNSSSLGAWLSDRVHYIVEESYDIQKSISLLDPNYLYNNANELPDLLGKSPLDKAQSGPFTVMANIGGAIYLEGKKSGYLFGLHVDGAGVVKLSSPRVGMLKIGEGMFKIYQINPAHGITETSASMARLAVLFHEARHSDGHGRSLSFLHALCPLGHEYAGNFACDNYLNGAYAVGAMTMRAMAESCANCNKMEKAWMRIEYLDSFSRILASAPTIRTEQQIDQLTSLVAGCDGMSKLHLPDLQGCAEIKKELAILKNQKNLLVSSNLDASPEGHR